jgi:uncharacterized membrane protein
MFWMRAPDEADLAVQRYDRANDPLRVLTLSDGVFAIILTLLVLEMHVPDLSQGQSLSTALQDVAPSFGAFLLSFVIVAIAWTGHRDLFVNVRRTDRTLVWLNMLYLLPVCILPFAAALLSRYQDEQVALEIYGVVLVAISVTRLTAWLYATNRPHLLHELIDAKSRRAGAAIVGVQALANAMAVGLAQFSTEAPMLIYAGTPIVYFIATALVRAGAPPSSAERNFT